MLTIEHSQEYIHNWSQHLYTVRLFGITLFRSYVKGGK